jgi:glycosyltransferase involved in cell wall biosynthesis
MDKKISVIVPTYNAEKYLKQTLNSIRFQTYCNLEIVCVLDCPTDNSADIAERIATEDRRIKLIYNRQNMGLPSARNIGVTNATGEYMHFMDSDDLINPNFYEILINAAVKANADVAACSVFWEKKPKQSIWFLENEIVFGQNKIDKTRVITEGWAWRYLIRKSFWDSRNLSFPDLVPMEDLPVMIPMVYYAKNVILCPNAVYFYKNRENSILNRNYNHVREKQSRENMDESRKIFEGFKRAHNIKEQGVLRRLSYKHAGKMICVNAPVEYGKIQKKISVVIPAHNIGKYLKQTLDSIRFQTYKNLEIVCVLESSTDNSIKIAEKAIKEDGRIKTVYNNHNISLSAAQNIGVKNTDGEYIHFVNSDDFISPDFYEIMISAALNADTDIATCSVFNEKTPQQSVWFQKSEILSGYAQIKKKKAMILGKIWRYLFRRSFWDSLDFNFFDLATMEDTTVMNSMIYHAKKIALCPSAVYFYKQKKPSTPNDASQRMYNENR